jgi:hypothetical protein
MMACTVVQQMLVRASESLNEPLHNSGHDDDLARLATRSSSRELQPQEAKVPKKEKQKKEALCTIGFWKPR